MGNIYKEVIKEELEYALEDLEIYDMPKQQKESIVDKFYIETNIFLDMKDRIKDLILEEI